MMSMAHSPPQQLRLSDLRALSVLGQGARGVVFHVVPVAASPAAGDSSAAGDPMSMALKAMSRAAARHKSAAGQGGTCSGGDDGHRRIWFERDVLLALRHPLLPSLRGVVATDAVVGFAIDCCPGGDLKSLLRRRWRADTMTLPDDVIRFYAAELVLVLEHLHGIGVVYRDLKPENVLIQDTGHIMLVDFDLSTTLPPPPPPPPPDQSSPSRPSSSRHRRRKNKNAAAMVFACFFSSRHAASPETSSSSESPQSTSMSASSSSCCSSSPAKSNSFVGTEDYVAPEIVAGAGHDPAVDWWGLGVVLYEMAYGRTPFRGQSRRETFHRLLTAAPPELAAGDGEPTTPLRDLIGRLLEKDPRKRLGAHGVKRHAFFRGVDWERVLNVARPPFIPLAPDGEDGDDAGVEEEAEALDVEKVVHEVFGTSGNGETPQEDVGSKEGRDYDFSMFF